MATLAQPIPESIDDVTAAENALCDIFFEALDELPSEKRQAVLADLRASAAHGE